MIAVFTPALCLASEFVGVMLLVTIKVDTAHGKLPNLPKAAPRWALHLILWPIPVLGIWALLGGLGH